jgi:hypothetical protein
MSRRELIGLATAGLAGFALAGCAARHGGTASRTATGPSTAPPDDEDPGAALGTTRAGDIALVQGALAGEQRLSEVCRQAVRDHPQLRPELAPVAAIADRHVQVLAAASPTSSAPTATVDAPPSSLLAVRATAQQQIRAEQRKRADGCLAAESAALARLLGSMSASHAMSASGLALARARE